MAALLAELELPIGAPRGRAVPDVPPPELQRATADEWVRWLSDHTATPWFGWSAETGDLLSRSPGRFPPYSPFKIGTGPAPGALQFVEPEPGLLCCQVAPRGVSGAIVLTSYVATQTERVPSELVLSAVGDSFAPAGEAVDLSDLPVCSRPVFERLVTGALAQHDAVRRLAQTGAEVEALAQQIDYCYEELSLLHSITEHLQLSTAPVELAELCLQKLQGLVDSSGHVIVLQDQDSQVHFLQRGEMPLDEVGLSRLLSWCEDKDWTRPIVRNHVSQSLLGADFPGLENFSAVAIGDGNFRRGWMVCCNLRRGEFGSVQANLLQSLSRILSTHLRNVELFCEHEQLMVSFVRSLVSTLDAKDPYTRGHSERVALIARRLGQELGLPVSDLDDIYLAGLLHDIGKIGVDDRILQKPDQLTEEEFRQIQRHPLIGFQILHQLGNLQHVLAGVRNHHEAYNGRGYPDRMQGDEIPLMARIMAVADSYDAMASDRPYRHGMPLDRLEGIFRRGAGQQWDPRVIDAYFAARDDIRQLCADYSPADGNLLQDRRSEGGPTTGPRTLLRH